MMTSNMLNDFNAIADESCYHCREYFKRDDARAEVVTDHKRRANTRRVAIVHAECMLPTDEIA